MTSIPNRIRQIAGVALVLAVAFSLSSRQARADFSLGSITTGTSPQAVAVNPVTNKIYVANNGSNSVTVIDAATNATSTVAVGTSPCAVAVNPVTNKIYVSNSASNNVTVIDGATNATTTVVANTNPQGVAVNPATNKIYVANFGSIGVTVIDGATNDAINIPAGKNPQAVAVNPVTNKIYVANFGSANVTVIDGATNASTNVPAGTNPYAVAVNPVTNKIYVANFFGNSVTVIDGATNAPATVATGTNPYAVAVNPATNKIYVANYSSANVTVIDGGSNAPTNIVAGTNPYAVAVNPVTSKIYVSNRGSANVTVIDAITNASSSIVAGTNPGAVAVNPVENKIYVANYGSANVTAIDGATNATTLVGAGQNPKAVAVNPATNKIYVANLNGSNVTAIDGATNTTATVATETSPTAFAVNPVTNKIYVANDSSTYMTIIDGATNATATLVTGATPMAVAVNPVTNKIYAANPSINKVTMIDGATNAITAISVESLPRALAVNPATNKIYVANAGSNSVTVIDGATNAAASVGAGTKPWAVAVNPVTNKIYVANFDSANVTVIDGATNATATVATGTNPLSVAVNPVTNKIYVANQGSNSVTVIDGASNTPTTLNAGNSPFDVAVNMAHNKIYVANMNGDNVTVIDGATNATSTIVAGTKPVAVAINPVTNKIYAANFDSANVTVIDASPKQASFLQTGITPLAANISYTASPVFNFTAASDYAPITPPVSQIYYQVDTMAGPWIAASPAGGSASGTTPALQKGAHMLYAFATDGQEASSTNGGSPVPGAVSAYPFFYGNDLPVASEQSLTVVKGASKVITLAGTDLQTLTFSVLTRPSHGTLSGTAPNLTFTAASSYTGPDSFTFMVSDGELDSAPATVSITVLDDVPVVAGQTVGTTRGVPVAITLAGTDAEPLSFRIVTQPAHGSLSGTTPNITYTPSIGYAGTDSFTFKANDRTQDSALATVTIAVTNVTPSANGQSLSVPHGASRPITLSADDLDPLAFSVLTQPSHGMLSGTAPNLTYTPDSNYTGSDSFTFKANDGLADSAPAAISIAVTNDTAVANAQTLNVVTGVPKAITLSGLDADPLVFSVATPPSHGALSGAAPHLVYTPAANFAGIDSFTFKASDGMADSAPATVRLVVAPPVYYSGNYVGLASGTVAARAGTISIASLGTGAFTGSLSFGGVTYRLKGVFDASGGYSATILRPKQSPLQLHLSFGASNGEDAITGSVSDESGSSEIVATNAIYSKATPAPQAGKYTVLIPVGALLSGSCAPTGSAAATLAVTTSGAMTFAGALADGTPFTQGATLARNGIWYLFLPIYAKTGTSAGMIQGKIQFEDTPGVSDLDGALVWVKPSNAKAANYPGGFTLSATLIGSAFNSQGSMILGSNTPGSFQASGGGLATALEEAATVASPAAAASLKVSGSNALALTINKATGVIAGSFIPQGALAKIPVKAVVFQKQGIGAGYFLNPKAPANPGGSVELTRP